MSFKVVRELSRIKPAISLVNASDLCWNYSYFQMYIKALATNLATNKKADRPITDTNQCIYVTINPIFGCIYRCVLILLSKQPQLNNPETILSQTIVTQLWLMLPSPPSERRSTPR